LYERLGYYGRKPSDFTHGYTYPEEVDKSNNTEAVEMGLPVDWAASLMMPVFGAEIERDVYAKQITALVGITGKPLADLEAKLGAPYSGGEQWATIASTLGLNVISTQYDPVSGLMEYKSVYAVAGGAAAEPKYIVLDPEGVPLQKHNRSYVLKHSELPESLRGLLG
jgi:hypothetical protein